MNILQAHLKNDTDMAALEPLVKVDPTLVVAFGDTRFFDDLSLGRKLKSKFPRSMVIGCSSAGEIADTGVYDNTLVVTAAKIPEGHFILATAKVGTTAESRSAGEKLGQELAAQKISSALILAPGLNINGGDLVDGLGSFLPPEVIVTGGLAGDGGRFEKTYTLWNEDIASDTVVALGMQGAAVRVSYGSEGGWEPFGLERRVTKAVSNILYEIDGKPALQLYKEYLGDRAKDLPASGLYFPFAVKGGDGSDLIRTILNIDEKAGSLILAGNIPEGSTVRLMHAKTGSLIDGASRASQRACAGVSADASDNLGILISCVGRKLVMGSDIDEEVEAVKGSFGPRSVLAGFYSYGEICALSQKNRRPCLHNQTMTITRLGQAS